MSDEYEPMKVSIVSDGRGSHVEPPLEQGWSELDKLRWKAGTVEASVGVTVHIYPGAMSTPRLFGQGHRIHWDRYGLRIGNSSHTAFTFDSAWDFLNGVEAGAEAVVRERVAA